MCVSGVVPLSLSLCHIPRGFARAVIRIILPVLKVLLIGVSEPQSNVSGTEMSVTGYNLVQSRQFTEKSELRTVFRGDYVRGRRGTGMPLG